MTRISLNLLIRIVVKAILEDFDEKLVLNSADQCFILLSCLIRSKGDHEGFTCKIANQFTLIHVPCDLAVKVVRSVVKAIIKYLHAK